VCRYSNTISSLETLKLLIKSGTSIDRRLPVVDLQDNDGWTALMWASMYSNKSSSLETVKVLIEAGASLDIQSSNGYTALMMASDYSTSTSSLETIKVLIESGASLDLQDIGGMTALMWASMYSNKPSSLETVKVLIEAGASLDLQSNSGWTALMLASRYSSTTSSLETVKVLIETGAFLDLQADGWTALMWASRFSITFSSLETVKVLIEAGASWNNSEVISYTPDDAKSLLNQYPMIHLRSFLAQLDVEQSILSSAEEDGDFLAEKAIVNSKPISSVKFESPIQLNKVPYYLLPLAIQEFLYGSLKGGVMYIPLLSSGVNDEKLKELRAQIDKKLRQIAYTLDTRQKGQKEIWNLAQQCTGELFKKIKNF